jgi:hypothetical protein
MNQVGHHTVKNMFKALPKIDDKAKLVEELESGGNWLHANAMSQRVADMCCAVNKYHVRTKNNGIKPFPNCPHSGLM